MDAPYNFTFLLVTGQQIITGLKLPLGLFLNSQNFLCRSSVHVSLVKMLFCHYVLLLRRMCGGGWVASSNTWVFNWIPKITFSFTYFFITFYCSTAESILVPCDKFFVVFRHMTFSLVLLLAEDCKVTDIWHRLLKAEENPHIFHHPRSAYL